VSRYGERFESGAARVRLCAEGFALSVREGQPIVMDRRTAQGVVHALTYALLATVPNEPPVRRSTPPRPAKVLAPRPTKQPAPRPAKGEPIKAKSPGARSPGPGRPAV
jgi:hypothetical protein